MSKIVLNPSASGTGVFTIASPNSDTDRTLTLPDQSGDFVLSASGVISDFTSTGIDDNATSTAITIDSSGHAIIPAGVTLGTATGTYNADNTLDDYEEGTSTTFVNGITATTNEVKMNYVKVGSLVHIIGEVNISGKSAGSGNPYFTLPFSPSSTFAFTSTVGASIHYNTISSNINYFGLYTSNAAVYGNTASGTYGNNYVFHTLWSDGRIGFSLTYTTF